MRQICDRAAVLDHGVLVLDGEPVEAARVFRDRLLQRGLDESDDPSATPHIRTVRITSGAITYPASAGRQYLETGEPLRIALGFATDLPHDDVVFALNLHDQSGQLVVGVNSIILDGSPSSIEGVGAYVFEFDSVPLNSGVYEVSLGIHTSGGILYDHRERAGHVQVSNPGLTEGRVVFPLTGRLEPAADQPVNSPTQ